MLAIDDVKAILQAAEKEAQENSWYVAILSWMRVCICWVLYAWMAQRPRMPRLRLKKHIQLLLRNVLLRLGRSALQAAD
jgi:hypothetical protein